MGFIPGILGNTQSSTFKKINQCTLSYKQSKKKYYMTVSMDAEKYAKTSNTSL